MIAACEDGQELIQSYLRKRGQRVTSISNQVLDQTTPDQMVVEYLATVQFGARFATLPFIAKFYGDIDGRIAFDAMRHLHTRLLDDAALAAPEAFCYDESLRILVQQRVPGAPCVRLVDGRSTVELKLLGSALACLHNLRGIESEPKTMVEHVDELVRPHPLVLAEALPEYRSLIEAALQTIHRTELAANFSFAATPIHRDFQLRQLFISPGRAWLVDWDTFAIGDPAFDVAYFLVYLNTHFEMDQAERMGDLFLTGYFRSQPSSVTDRLFVYEIFNYLRRACRRFRVRDRGWEREMHRMFQQLDARLT